MAEFTGNVHNLELTLPFPPPSSTTDTVFVIGRTFGDPAGGTDGLDIWIDDSADTTFDPPGGPAATIPVATMLACVHGWLRFVPAGSAVPGLTDRTGSALQVENDSLLLNLWPTLIDNLERMAEDGSVLVPQLESGKGGRPAVNHIVYENVNTTTVRPAIAAIIKEQRPDQYFSVAQRTAMADAFFAGELQILARAGCALGIAADGAPSDVTRPASADGSWKRITLRVADRFGQLFDPGFFLRRFREIGEIAAIPLLMDQKVIPSREAVATHPLPGLTPARRIVDWRDDFGRPVAGAAFFLVAEGTDTSTVTPNTTNSWGLWLSDPPTGDVLAVETMVIGAEAEHIAIGTLPNAPFSRFRLTRHVLADDYLVVSAVNLADWFPDRPEPESPTEEPLRRYTQGNRVTRLVDGRQALFAIYMAMRRTFVDDDFSTYVPGNPLPDGPLLDAADRSGHVIYLCNWQLSPHLHIPELPPGYVEVLFDDDGNPLTAYDPRGHVMGVLRAAIAAGVDVRGLFWRQLQPEPNPLSSNVAAVNGINAEDPPTFRGQAILDELTRSTGSQHQKVTVIENADGRRALLGGVDLALGRWDSNEHRPNDPRSQPGRAATPENPTLGWHDVHCEVEGPAVDDIEVNFRQRWNFNPASETEGRSDVPSRIEPLIPLPGAPHFVQINRTVPPGLAQYQFVSQSNGDPGIRIARLNAIRRARNFIYLEEQYLTMVHPADHQNLMASPTPLTFEASADTDAVAVAMRERLVGTNPVSFIAVLLPRTLNEDPPFVNMVLYALRKRFIEFLTHGLSDEQKRDRLLVFHLRNESGVATYVHAKTMIVDDLWASIGSSNMNYRSMTYDTEINCDVVDGAIRKGQRPLTLDLRVALMAEHLLLAANERHQVVDPREGFELLRRAAEDDLPGPHHVQPYEPDYFGDDLAAPDAPPPYDPSNPNHELIRRHMIDPDGRNPDDPLLDYAALLALAQGV